MVSKASGRQPRTKSIDEKISELIPQLADRCYNCRISEHLRQRYFCNATNLAGNDKTLTMMVNVRLSANDLVGMYMVGGTATPVNQMDILKYYALLHQYLELWAERSNVNPDEEQPPIEDFVNVDDFLRSIHSDWFVMSIVCKKPLTETKSRFRSRRFSESVVAAQPTSPLAKPPRYQSMIDRFHANVWSK